MAPWTFSFSTNFSIVDLPKSSLSIFTYFASLPGLISSNLANAKFAACLHFSSTRSKNLFSSSSSLICSTTFLSLIPASSIVPIVFSATVLIFKASSSLASCSFLFAASLMSPTISCIFLIVSSNLLIICTSTYNYTIKNIV